MKTQKWPDKIKMSWKDYHTILFFHDLSEIHHKMLEMRDSDLYYEYIHQGLINIEEFETITNKIGEWARILTSRGGNTGRKGFILDVK